MTQRMNYMEHSPELNAWNRINIAFKPVPGSLDKAWGLDKVNFE